MAYEGIDPDKAGKDVYLPNITRNYLGWTTPFVVQNVGTSGAKVTVKFYRKGSSSAAKTLTYSIAPGASKGINPGGISSLGTFQGSVVVKGSSGDKIGAICNEHYQGNVQTMSYNGFESGDRSAYLPNVTSKYSGWNTPFAVQNVGTSGAKVTVKFYRKGSSTAAKTLSLSIAPGASKGINPANYSLGVFQGSVVIKGSKTSDKLVAVCNEHSATDSMAYSSLKEGATKNYLANITRKYYNWTTPFVIQNLDSTSAKVNIRFYNTKGTNVLTLYNQTIATGASKGYNPGTYGILGTFKGSVVVECTNGKTVATIVNEQQSPGGQAMSYNGF